MENRTLPILVKPHVKAFFLHEKNLGSAPVIEKRHWLGRHIASVVSFHPLDKSELPIEYTEPKHIAKLVTLEVEVTFPLKIYQLDMHHYLQLGYVLECIFELNLSGYAKGYFSMIVNYQGAVNKFYEEYELSDELYDRGAAYKVVEREYTSALSNKSAKKKTFVGK